MMFFMSARVLSVLVLSFYLVLIVSGHLPKILNKNKVKEEEIKDLETDFLRTHPHIGIDYVSSSGEYVLEKEKVDCKFSKLGQIQFDTEDDEPEMSIGEMQKIFKGEEENDKFEENEDDEEEGFEEIGGIKGSEENESPEKIQQRNNNVINSSFHTENSLNENSHVTRYHNHQKPDLSVAKTEDNISQNLGRNVSTQKLSKETNSLMKNKQYKQ